MKLNDLIGCLFVTIICGAVWIAFYLVGQYKPKTMDERMDTCDFPSYSQAIECRKVKAIKDCYEQKH